MSAVPSAIVSAGCSPCLSGDPSGDLLENFYAKKFLKKRAYRVQEDHTFVHYLQVACHKCKILPEFSDQGVHLVLWDLDDEAIAAFHMLGRDHELTGKSFKIRDGLLLMGDEDLNLIPTVTEVMLALVQNLFLHRALGHIPCIAPFLIIEGLWCRSSFLLFSYLCPL